MFEHFKLLTLGIYGFHRIYNIFEILDGLPPSSYFTSSLIPTYQGNRFNAGPLFSVPHSPHLSSIILMTKLSTGLERRLVVTRGRWAWSLQTPRVMPTSVCLNTPLKYNFLNFDFNNVSRAYVCVIVSILTCHPTFVPALQ